MKTKMKKVTRHFFLAVFVIAAVFFMQIGALAATPIELNLAEATFPNVGYDYYRWFYSPAYEDKILKNVTFTYTTINIPGSSPISIPNPHYEYEYVYVPEISFYSTQRVSDDLSMTVDGTNETWAGSSGWINYHAPKSAKVTSESNYTPVSMSLEPATDASNTLVVPIQEGLVAGDTISFNGLYLYVGGEISNSSGTSGYSIIGTTIKVVVNEDEVLGTVSALSGGSGEYRTYYLGSVNDYTLTKPLTSISFIGAGRPYGLSLAFGDDPYNETFEAELYYKFVGKMSYIKGDTEGPTVSISGNPTTWSTQANLTISATDLSGLDTNPYSWDGGATWTQQGTKSFTSNGDVSIQVRDSVGNITTTSVSVTRVDSTKPSIGSIQGQSTAYALERTITINAADSQSGLLRSDGSYSFDNGNTWKTTNSFTFSQTTTTSTVCVRDACGNISTQKINVFVDRESPTISSVSGESTTYAKSRTLTVSASDSHSGLSGSAYSFDGGLHWQNSNSYTYTQDTKTAVIAVRDSLGNVKSKNVNVYVDVSAPTISSVAGESTSYSTGRKITISASDSGSGVGIRSDGSYSYDGGVTWCSENYHFYDEGSLTTATIQIRDGVGNVVSKIVNVYIDNLSPEGGSIIGNPEAWTKDDVTLTITGVSDKDSGLNELAYNWNNEGWTSNAEYKVSKNSVVSCVIRDCVGNTATRTITVTKIDKTSPSISNILGTQSTWTQNPVTVSITAEDNQCGLNASAYSFDGGLHWQTENSYTYVSDIKTSVIAVRDGLGNIASRTIDIYLDTTAPAITSIVGDSTTYAAERKITVYATDSGSGVGSRGDGSYSYDNGVSWCTENYHLYEGQTIDVVSIRIRDSVGNIIETKANVFIDNTPPVAGDIQGNPTEWTNEDVTLTIVGYSDANSGISGSSFNWNNEGWSTDASVTVSKNSYVSCKVRDAAGNISEKAVEITRIDKTNPVISTISGIPTNWTNEPVTVAVSAADAQSGLNAEAYSFDDGTTWQVSNETTIEDNGIYALRVRDAVGNETSKPFRVSYVDTKAPEITVSYIGLSDDRKNAITKIVGIDNCSTKLKYCLSYDEETPEMAEWDTINEMALAVGKQVTVACKDEVGNISIKSFTPNANLVGNGSGSELPLFTKNVLPIAGYTFGSLNAGGYCLSDGSWDDYQVFMIDSLPVTGLCFEIEAASSGGVLAGSATLLGQEFPIYWDRAFTTQTSSEGGTGYIVIDAAKLTTNAKNATLKVVLNEYEDDSMDYILNSDVIKAAVRVDCKAPIITIIQDPMSGKVVLRASDAVSGVKQLLYRLSDEDGYGEWMTYSEPLSIEKDYILDAYATDNVNNVAKSEGNSVARAFSQSMRSALSEKAEVHYRTNCFNYYLFGGK